MTLFGKILVFFNLAFGLLLAGWAFNLYANGIDWTDRKEGNTPVGEFAIHEAQLDELWKGVPPAQADWRRNRDALQKAEASLAADRVWYDKEMWHVFAGPTKDDPVGQIVVAAKDVLAAQDDPRSGVKKGDILVRKGQVLLDDKGYPQLAPLKDRAGKPLESLAEYNEKDRKVLLDLEGVMKKHEEQIAEANKLTDRIIGDKDKGVRGLQKRIEDERAKDADVVAEQKLIRPLLINTVVESELIFKRKTQLERRIEELKKFKVAGR
jgi:hypothetical protein